ncbi:hypothetical protein [Cupriavidus laharis]|uniref:hypothetical protein n=1 Tax=Cupriavidus laharis TaxID=151654 RepID=UPI001CC77E61|nr:hypothetical protein [Cupriavidus laharis]
MPVDFCRVPPRVTVPAPPHPSVLFWSALLAVFLGAAIALTIVMWPPGRPTNVPLFWLCCLVYPCALWAFFLALSLGYGHMRCDTARADNLASDEIESQCHDEASVPLAVLGHAWRFAGDKDANDVTDIVSGATQLGLRPSGAEPDSDVRARWLEIPGKPFYPGNALGEHQRHLVISEWLLAELIEDMAPGLDALPAGCSLQVHLSLQSMLDLDDVCKDLETRLQARVPALRITTTSSADDLPLSEVDTWHDTMTNSDAQLLIAIQLRRAISQRLVDGEAEVGVALLLGHPGSSCAPFSSPGLALHRPAVEIPDAAAKAVSLATRWGQTEAARVRTIWCHLPSEELVREVKSLPEYQPALWIDVGASVGNCAGAGAWLTTALAIAHASRDPSPQIVLSQHDHNVIALVCKKQV